MIMQCKASALSVGGYNRRFLKKATCRDSVVAALVEGGGYKFLGGR